MLRRLNMPLPRVAEVVSAPGPVAAELVTAFWAEEERRIASQRELMAYIKSRLLGQEGRLPLPAVQERDVIEQLVISERRHVPVDKLPAWIGEAMMRLAKAARRYGGAVAAPFVVYYGEINEDSDCPAEACVPIDPASEDSADPSIRREPAHREAYLRLKKAQVGFPQMLSAYDGVARWISAMGFEFAGAPREVYFTDVTSAGPDDEVCDVAFLIGAV
jgi:hypothetical protein